MALGLYTLSGGVMLEGFASSTTKSIDDVNREVETRMKGLDTFTDDFNPPDAAADIVPGQDVSKSQYGYEKKHDDFKPRADRSFTLAAVGDADEQAPMDALDREVYEFEAQIKKEGDQFPGSLLRHLEAGVDEALWSKAKDASKEAFGRVKWPFVQWWYKKHGGK